MTREHAVAQATRIERLERALAREEGMAHDHRCHGDYLAARKCDSRADHLRTLIARMRAA